MRDDFSKTTRDNLARRVGFLCSNPTCQKLTSGPQLNKLKSVDIGVAAHMAAASPGGPRYDSKSDSEQRKSIGNGIWLCQTCAKLIENDPLRFDLQTLEKWKISAEAHALELIQRSSGQATPRISYPVIEFKISETPQNLALQPIIIIHGEESLHFATISIIEARFVRWEHNPIIFQTNQQITLHADLDNDCPEHYRAKIVENLSLQSIIRCQTGIFNQSTEISRCADGVVRTIRTSVYKEARGSSFPNLYFQWYDSAAGTYRTQE